MSDKSADDDRAETSVAARRPWLGKAGPAHVGSQLLRDAAAQSANGHPMKAWNSEEEAVNGTRRPRATALLVALAGCLVAVSALTGLDSAVAGTAVEDDAVCTNVHGIDIFLSADPTQVRREANIPLRWKLATTRAGRSLLLEFVGTCKWTVRGVTRMDTYRELAALLDPGSMPQPERSHDTSNLAGRRLDLYLISSSSNDATYEQWMRDRGGLGSAAVYNPHLSLTTSGIGLQTARYQAPTPDQSPFVLTETATVPFILVPGFDANYWHQNASGTYKIDDGGDPAKGQHVADGQYLSWTFTTTTGSPLARMLGTARETSSCSPLAAPSPLIAIVTGTTFAPGCIGGESGSATWKPSFWPSATLQ